MISKVYFRFLLAVVLFALIIAIATVVLKKSSTSAKVEQKTEQKLPENIDVALKRAHFSEMKDGTVLWELLSDRVHYDKTGDKAYLFDIKMTFERDNSHGKIIVTADSGEYSIKAKNIFLKGRVHVLTEDEASFDTDSINYYGETAQFKTYDKVIFSQQRIKLTAVGMDLGVKNQRAHFHSSVNSSIRMN